jgi:hypothetical protein
LLVFYKKKKKKVDGEEIWRCNNVFENENKGFEVKSEREHVLDEEEVIIKLDKVENESGSPKMENNEFDYF